MKTTIFNQYVDKVCFLFNVDREVLFSKTTRRDLVDARQLLYYLCSQRPMRLVYIQEYMSDNGYEINHSSIHHGISVVKKKMETDKDYIIEVNHIVNER